MINDFAPGLRTAPRARPRDPETFATEAKLS